MKKTLPVFTLLLSTILCLVSAKIVRGQTPVFYLNASGVIGSNSFFDSSPGNHPISANDNPINSLSCNDTTVYIDGSTWAPSGHYLLAPASPDFDFGSGDFTIHFWVYLQNTSSTHAVFDFRQTAAEHIFLVYYPGTGWLYSDRQGAGTIVAQSTPTMLAQTWTHVALVRSGNNFTIYINGCPVANSVVSSPISTATGLSIGYSWDNRDQLNGYIDEFYIYKGTALWNAGFLPPRCSVFSSCVSCSSALSASVLSTNIINCNGDSTGSITVSPSGGFSPYTYQWSGYASNQIDSIADGLPAGTYTVIVGDQSCISDTLTVVISQPTPIAANLSVSDTSICLGENISLSSLPTGGTPNYSYSWSNNINAPSQLVSPLITTTYTLSLTDSHNCTKDTSINISVHIPVSNFNSVDVCLGDSVHFINTSSVNTGIISAYHWNFGDGSTSTNQNSGHLYSNPGTYTVTLKIISDNGCADSITKIVTVSKNPIATANVNSNLIAVGSVINLSTDTTSGIVWSGPNGFTSILQNPVITNAQPTNSGTYRVIKTNGFGCADTAELVITVYQPELPDNTIDDDGDGLIDCADPDLATLHQCYKCGYDSIAWKTVVPEAGFNKGIAVKYTGFNQYFVVPSYVTSIKIKAWGAGGGGGYSSLDIAAGAGGYTIDELNTGSGQVYVVVAGEGGWSTRNTNQIARSTFGFGGSGNSTGSAAISETGSGGGLSGIFFNTVTPYNARVVAGGGGGIGDADGSDETSGGNGNNPFSGGYLPLTGQDAPPNSTGFGGGGGGYVGGISGIDRFSYSGHLPDIYADGGEGGSGFKSTSNGQIKYTTEIDIYPPDTSDVHYIQGIGVGTDYNVPVGFVGDVKTGGNGLVVIQWFEPLEDLTILSSKDTICKGDSLTLTAIGQSIYTWSPAITLSSDTAKTVIAQPIGNSTYQIISNYNNCKDTAQISIIVNQLPVLTLTNDTAICNGTSVALNVSGANTYAWSPGAGLNSTSGAFVITNSTSNQKYFVNGTDTNGCVSLDSVSITIDSIPIPTVSGNHAFCLGDSTTITATGGNHYLWSNGDTTTTISVAPTLNAIYSVIVKNSFNCTDSSTFNTIVHALPLPDFDFTTVCDGTNMMFNNASSINPSDTIQAYLWSFGDGSALDNNISPSHLYTMDSAYSVNLTAVSNFGCIDSISKTVVVNPNPIVAFTADDTIGCAQLCVTFQDLSSIHTGVNTQWTWTFGDGSPATNLQNPNYCYNNNAAPVFYSITLTVTSDSGCVTTLSKNNYITVHPNPTALFAAAGVCDGNNVMFSDFSSIPATDVIQAWTWNFGDGSPINTNPIITGGYLYNSPNAYTASLLVVSNAGCKDSINKTIFIHPNPVVGFSVSDTIGCEPLCISFNDASSILSGNNITQWIWDIGDGTVTNNSPTFDHCYNNNSITTPALYTVTLTAVSDSGCATTLIKNNYVTVYANTVADFSVSPQNTTITDPLITITNLSINADSSFWNFGDTQTSVLINPNPYSYADTGVYNITLITNTQYGCFDTTYQTVTIEPDFLLYIPSAFSPNGDNINDTFIAQGDFINEFEMSIFDRWGNLIYKTNSIAKPWDGKAHNGADMAQEDVYVYSIKATDLKLVKHNFKGVVTLIK
jgi:gliding motility-associated-like protein